MVGSRNIAVVGVYPDQLTAEDGVDTLRQSGFRSTDISVLFADCHEARSFAAPPAAGEPVIGGALGSLSGIGSLAVPGAGPYVAAGPLMGMLGGIGVAAAPSGVSGALLGLGLPEPEAARTESSLRHGCILLSVHCDSSEQARRAKSILQETGAEDVSVPATEQAKTN